MEDICVVVPTLNPNVEALNNFLNKLKKDFKNIVLFDDGCRDEYNPFFKKCEKNGITVLHHYVNLGKGRSLKDAFNYILVNMPKIKGVVTCDSDGQHSIKDIKKCAELVLENPNDLILGCRDFNEKNVPLRNKTGNKITCAVFSLFVGLKVSDTQTGLRGLSRNVMAKFLDDDGERFEYETSQLINTKEKNVKIKEFRIETIYEEKGKYETHFNPLTDSIAIYKTFFKYIFAALSSFAIDILLFALFHNFASIIISTIMARCVSSTFNYLVNSKTVFKSSSKSSIFKYFILVIVQMFMSGFITDSIVKLVSWGNTFVIVIKIIVDSIIFIVNYYIQRRFVFNK